MRRSLAAANASTVLIEGSSALPVESHSLMSSAPIGVTGGTLTAAPDPFFCCLESVAASLPRPLLSASASGRMSVRGLSYVRSMESEGTLFWTTRRTMTEVEAEAVVVDMEATRTPSSRRRMKYLFTERPRYIPYYLYNPPGRAPLLAVGCTLQ